MLFYVGFCPVCGEGTLGVRICGGPGHAVILCDECDAVWPTVDVTQTPVFPAQPQLPCPHCGATLVGGSAHWAAAAEIRQVGWQDAVIGSGPAPGDADRGPGEDTGY
jgi:hypothetical protein